MATQPVTTPIRSQRLQLDPIASFSNLRVLAWDCDVLYASRGYELLSLHPAIDDITWTPVANYRPAWWRNLTSRNPLAFRLVRDGFHALAVVPGGSLVAAVPGAIVTLPVGETEFQVSHRITRGTRPLHVTAAPDGRLFWGEYFDNPARAEVHIYASCDGGLTWETVYTFGRGSIRHVHNLVFDRWQNCLWIFTGDFARECRIIRASLDLKTIDEVFAGNQQARAVAVVVTADGVFFASDTPLEQNYIYFLDRGGAVERLCALPSSSICSCQNRNGVFFSTMVEPSEVNRDRNVRLFGSADGLAWNCLGSWRKDPWPMKWFQYGNAFLPDGENTTDYLAVTTIAVENDDLCTSIVRTTIA